MIAALLGGIATATGSQWGPGHGRGRGSGFGQGWHHGFGFGGDGWGSALALALAAAALALAIWALVRTRRPRAGVVGGGGGAALEILGTRLARGEIAPEEYSSRAAVLGGAPPASPGASAGEETPSAEGTSEP